VQIRAVRLCFSFNRRLVAPATVNGTVPPRRKPNSDARDREHLTEAEIERLMKAAGENRYGHRDTTMILIAFRHGLRPVEVCNLKWDSIDLAKARIHVNRAKNGEPSTHPLSGVELRALRRLKRKWIESPFVFVSERGSPFTTAGYRKMIARLGEAARFSFPVHPHMLRHACGYKLANDGRDTRALQHYLGHKSIQHTVRYTKLSPDRFRDFWRD
jgi:type 1 fimbriae regulatory protein FimB/type 1 fimbriae regulatory protein FimE